MMDVNQRQAKAVMVIDADMSALGHLVPMSRL